MQKSDSSLKPTLWEGGPQQAQEKEAYRDTGFPITIFSSHLYQCFKSIKEQRNILELRSNAIIRLEKNTQAQGCSLRQGSDEGRTAVT